MPRIDPHLSACASLSEHLACSSYLALPHGRASDTASTEKHQTRPRAVDLRVAGRAVGVLRVLVVLRTGRFRRADVVSQAVASQAKLIDRAEAQQTRIRRAVRRMASRASFCLYRRMFVSEWT